MSSAVFRTGKMARPSSRQAASPQAPVSSCPVSKSQPAAFRVSTSQPAAFRVIWGIQYRPWNICCIRRVRPSSRLAASPHAPASSRPVSFPQPATFRVIQGTTGHLALSASCSHSSFHCHFSNGSVTTGLTSYRGTSLMRNSPPPPGPPKDPGYSPTVGS